MISNDPSCNSVFRIAAQLAPGLPFDDFHHRHEQLRFVNSLSPLHHGDRTLNTHTSINIGLLELVIAAVASLLILHEHIVPDLTVLAARTARLAVRPTRIDSRIDEHLGVRSAWPRAAG